MSLPGIVSLNARSISIKESDELLAVARINDVSCASVTETMFCCERKDRVDRGGGGAACHVLL